MKKQYCIDSSSLISAKHIRYPMDNFPSVWEKFEDLIKDGTFVISRHVYDEVTHGEDDLAVWMKKHSKLVVQVDAALIQETARLTTAYSIVDPDSTKEIADPYVVALAKLRSIPCVNEETSSKGKKYMKIPDVCEKEGVRSMTLVQVIRELALKF